MSKVDLSNYEGREQAYVKHSLLEGYLPELVYRVGKKWDSFVYVDGFAGPWKTHDPDHADSSFGIAIDTLRRSQKGLLEAHGQELHVKCILIEQDKVAFAELARFAANETSSNFEVHALQGEFVEKIPAIHQLVKSHGLKPLSSFSLIQRGGLKFRWKG